jgi:hypothetical protein
MSSSMLSEVFDLSTICDNPIFEGFAFEVPPYKSPSLLGRETLEDDIEPGFGISNTERMWSPPRLKGKWHSPRVVGRVVPFNDYPCANTTYPVFSRRACESLREFLLPNGELLPVKSERGEFYFYNLTTVVDALDVERSRCNFWPSRPMTAFSVEHFEFHASRLKGLSIFRIIDWPQVTLVSREFVDRVHDQGLNGFRFRKVWPLAQGENWRMQDRGSVERKTAKSLAQHTLVIIFRLAGRKPARAESKLIKQIEDELDAQLVIQYHNARFFGSYDGIDTVEGEMRLFVMCPDVDALVQKLLPWLRNLDWPRNVYLMKRYGEMYDEAAKEELIELKK